MPQRHALKALPSHSLLAVAGARCIGARACRIQFKAFCWKLAGTISTAFQAKPVNFQPRTFRLAYRGRGDLSC